MRKRGKGWQSRRQADTMALVRRLHHAQIHANPAPLSADQVRDLSLAYHESVDAISKGEGTFEHLNNLACMANMALVLVEQGFGVDDLDDVKEAQDAVVRAEMRRQGTGRVGFSGVELQAVRKLMVLHDAQLEHEACTDSVVMQVLVEVHKRMARGDVLSAVAA